MGRVRQENSKEKKSAALVRYSRIFPIVNRHEFAREISLREGLLACRVLKPPPELTGSPQPQLVPWMPN
jgi:hypothetical protein